MNEQVDEARIKQIEEMKRGILAKILDKDAFERLGRVRIADPALAMQVELYLMQMFQGGKLPEKVNDSKLKEILAILSEKKDINIKRR